MLMNKCLAVVLASEHVLPPCVPINERLCEGAFLFELLSQGEICFFALRLRFALEAPARHIVSLLPGEAVLERPSERRG